MVPARRRLRPGSGLLDGEERQQASRSEEPMELRTIDPRVLKENPDNPRRSTASRHADDQLTASVKAIGIIQPPVVTEREGELVIVAGHRRVRAAIAAGLERIGILVNGGDPSGMMALSENVVRAQLGPVDQWRGIERLEAMGWNEEGIATALALPVRTVRKLKLLAHVHKPMLERMAAGEMPREEELRIIAAASREEQAQVWKRHRPRKGEAVGWHAIRRALEKHRLWAKAARFDQAAAEAFGIVWEDDLFAPADEDTRYTTQAEAFLAAQLAWLVANLPPNGVLLEEDEYGQARLPPKAQRIWGEPGSSDTIGYWIVPATGEIGTIAYRLPEARRRDARNELAAPARLRPEITKRGNEIIGELRTTALHQALREAPIADDTLLAMLVVAFGGHNVQVQSGSGRTAYGSACPAIAAELSAGGALGQDPELVRACARAMLVEALSCRSGPSDSGHVARLRGRRAC
jgi:ParB/RepB/Spo0J family partition protein